MSDLTYAVAEIREARGAYETAERYYEGEVAEVFASPAIRKRLEQTSGEYGVNLACRPVDAVLDRLELLSATTADPGAADWLTAQWTRNDMAAEAEDAHWAAEVYGDAYVTVWPGEESGDVDLFYNSPLCVRVFYDTENPRHRRYAAKLWAAGAGPRVNLYYADRVEKWVLSEDAKGGGEQDDDWEHYSVEGDWEIPHDLGEVPVFHFRTRRPYGKPEHKNAYGPQNIVTKQVATLMGSTDFQGFPQRYAISGAVDSLSSLGDDFDDETRAPDAGTSDLKAGPGELWTLRNVDKVGQFDAANVEAFLRPITATVRYMSATTATPVHYFEPTGDAPSGESLRAAEAPLVKKVQRRRRQFGAAWRAALRCALRAGGHGEQDVDVWWAPIQTIDDLAGWQAAKAKIEAGVPTRQALLEAGYSAEQVDGWGFAEDNEIKPKVAVLAQLGAAVQSLGAGVALGVISAGQVERAVSELIGEDGGGDGGGG